MPQLKQIALQIFHETLAAIDIPATMQRKLRRKGALLVCGETRLDLGDFEKLRVVAIGKAAHAMVDGLALVLAPFVRLKGVVSASTAARRPLVGMKYFVAGHPVPNAESWKAAEAILALLESCDEKTLVFFLLSGGGSALVELPLDPSQTLEDVQQMHRALVTCGAPIEAINSVRKHISVEKGADHLLQQLEELQKEHTGQRVALIADGEVSSPVTGKGIGGRNSAFVLACVEKIAGKKIAVLSAGTDGIDGNSPAAGAVADGQTLTRARSMGLEATEAFRRSDAFTFFSKLEDAILTGPTGNNLRDLRILIAEP